MDKVGYCCDPEAEARDAELIQWLECWDRGYFPRAPATSDEELLRLPADFLARKCGGPSSPANDWIHPHVEHENAVGPGTIDSEEYWDAFQRDCLHNPVGGHEGEQADDSEISGSEISDSSSDGDMLDTLRTDSPTSSP